MTTAAPDRLKRVDRWLIREGLGQLTISWDAARVLDSRLQARTRGKIAFAIMGVVAAACIFGPSVTNDPNGGGPLGPGLGNGAAVAWAVAYVAALAVGAALDSRLVVVGERAVGAWLPRRVTDGRNTRLRTEMGSIAFGVACFTLACAVALLGLFWAIGAPTALIISYMCGLIVVTLCVWSSIQAISTSPAVAIDADSLAIDKRMRTTDLTGAVMPLAILVCSIGLPIGAVGGHRTGLDVLAMFAPLPMILVSLAQLNLRRSDPALVTR